MQELEKILEEVEKLKEMYKESSFALLDKGNLPCEYDKSDIESAKVQAISEAVAIIRKHMSGKDTGVPTNSGWIPVDDERLWNILFEEACIEGEQERRIYNRLKETFVGERSKKDGKF